MPFCWKRLKKSGKAGLARFVLRSTESLCIVHPVDKSYRSDPHPFRSADS
jgi:non-homologous end joining protein Ku